MATKKKTRRKAQSTTKATKAARKKTSAKRVAKRTPKRRRRPKADTATARAQAVQEAAAEEPLDPPAHVTLRPGDRPFWDDIIETRARSTWTRADLVKAAILARTMADIERVQKQINREGNVVRNRFGTKVVNPRHQLLETLTRRSINLARVLHVHATATQGRSRDTGEKTKREREAREAARLAEGDPLIAPPVAPSDQLH